MAIATPPRGARIGRLERPALTGVLVREIVNYSSYWRASAFSSTVEPTLYLLAFGFGFGSLVSTIGGYDYVEFVATGTVATAVLFSSAFPAMFGTYVKYAVPAHVRRDPRRSRRHRGARLGGGAVDVEPCRRLRLRPARRRHLLRARALVGNARRCPGIAFISGFGWANFGIAVAGYSKSIDNFSYIVSAVLTPLFLVAGTFFPLDGLPQWVQILAELNPLHHCVELVRHAVFGWEGWTDVLRVGFLVAFGLAMWRLAIRAMTSKLID